MAIGGVLRDHRGGFRGAFAGSAGQGTSLQAEILALHHGLRLVSQVGLRRIDIWTDSRVLVNHIGKAAPY